MTCIKKFKKLFSMKKGFIGPISDDLPSLIAILLALTMFFSALDFSLTEYNEKVSSFNTLKGVMQLGRAITSKGLLDSSENSASLATEIKEIAKSYGLSYCVTFGGSTVCKASSSLSSCKPNWVRYSYLVSQVTSNGIKIKELSVCGGQG